MKFNVRYSYNLDLLDLFNILTGEVFYLDWHAGIFELFGQNFSHVLDV
jgi:hypothetical protein